MKKSIVLLLLCGGMSYSQDLALATTQTPTEHFMTAVPNKLLAVKDFKITDGRMIVTEIPCQIISDDNIHRFVVSVVCQQNAFREMGVEKINEIILFANQKAQATIGHKQSYSPMEIKMSYNPMIKNWSLTHLFSTQEKDSNSTAKLLSMDFDSTGKFLVMKKIR